MFGEDHKRHRRIMNPAFGMSEIKSLVPVFFEAVSTLTNKWKDILLDAKDQSEVFNITKWASRATLDAFGHAGFDYDFGAMEDKDNRLAAAAEMFASPTDGMLAGGTLLSSIMPSRLMIWALERMSHSNPRLARGRIMRETATEVAGKVLAEKSKELESGNGGRFKDLMSLLSGHNVLVDFCSTVKANTAPQNENNRMSDEELMAQLLALFIAGHETTANSLSWTLLELCRNPKIQTKLRQEIHQKEREIAAQGRLERGFTAEDLESLTYLDAVVKESLRFQPVVSRMHKTALTNDVLPLSQPVRTTSGVEINEIPIAKGQKAFFSIGTYQRNKALFGEDADIFRPERWLENSHIINKTTSAGVYANLWVPPSPR
ncbi:hypothetical protein V5O48_006319 [Marasmius crinis-equi]|uniref:Cytochrome P450 n=1 Tax=Marasmius crinis-equi TaxID=585013 RepID=A0ABR3FJU8_9AGAR